MTKFFLNTNTLAYFFGVQKMNKKGIQHCHWVPTSLSTLLLLLLLLAWTLKLRNVETQSNNFMFDFPHHSVTLFKSIFVYLWFRNTWGSICSNQVHYRPILLNTNSPAYLLGAQPMKKKGRLHCHWVPTSLSTLLLLLLLLARSLKLQNVETQSNNFMFDILFTQ
jgi:hypothetical protein